MTLKVSVEILPSSRPPRPVKQTIGNIDPVDPDRAYELQPSAFLPTPSLTYDGLLEVPRSSGVLRNHQPGASSNGQSIAQPQPKPVRPLQEAFEDDGSNPKPAIPRNRHLLQSPSHSAISSPLKVCHPTRGPSNASAGAPVLPKSLRPPKRALQDGNVVYTPTRNGHRPHLPSISCSRVEEWLSTILPSSDLSTPRPSSAPPQFSSREALRLIDNYQPVPLATIQRMTNPQGQILIRESYASSQAVRPGTSHPIYRELLFFNGIRMDFTGRRMPTKVREMMNEQIFQRRSSPPLSEETVCRTIMEAEALASSAEEEVSKLVASDMFPVMRSGVGAGGNTMWSTDALPYNPVYDQPLAAPKPDFHYGYPPGLKSDWSIQENTVVNHRVARPYTQPARGNRFPFLVLEMKSEATGGTLWHAENQAAGSGSHCVKAMKWFLEQAYPTKNVSITDCIAFTGVVNHRQIIFYVHYHSEEDGYIYMSYLRRFWTTDPEDVQRCHDLVKNILDYGLTTRQTKIKNACARLYPLSTQWGQARPFSMTLIPTTSVGVESRPRKRARKMWN